MINRVLGKAKEINISWSLDTKDSNAVLAEELFPSVGKSVTSSRMSKTHRTTMHISRKPGEQVEVGWAGSPCRRHDLQPVYTYVETFLDMKQRLWLSVHVHCMNTSAVSPKS